LETFHGERFFISRGEEIALSILEESELWMPQIGNKKTAHAHSPRIATVLEGVTTPNDY